MSVSIRLTSFGYLHAPPPQACVTLDVSDHLRDPHIDPRLREMTGKDAEVVAKVLGTPGALATINGLLSLTSALASPAAAPGPSADVAVDIAVAVGCAGGRHRSVVIVDQLFNRLANLGIGDIVKVEHRDVDKAVVRRTAHP